MAGDLLGVSVTGLRVAQTSLGTIGHNIANAGVDGYSRQSVNAETNPSTLTGGQYQGSGASVASIERQVNDFLIQQLRDDTTLSSDMDVYYDSIQQLDTLLSDSDTGLTSAFESFFSSMQNGADDPTSIPSRQLIISESENLSDRFNSIYDRLESINDGLDTALESAVTQVNALVENLADLNQKISEAIGTGNGAQPNDLLDLRDETLKELSKFIAVQTYEQGFGQVNVVIGSGKSLVVGSESRQIDLISNPNNPGELQLAVVGTHTSQIINTSSTGGEIGGLLRFREDRLQDTYNQLGQVGIVIADTMNTQHASGIDLNNEFGGGFFYDINDIDISRDRVTGSSGNALPQDRVLHVDIVDSANISSSDYRLEIATGGLFTVERESDGAVVSNGLFAGGFPFSIEFDGLELMFEGGSFQAGDSFEIQPTRTASRDFSSVIINPEDIAFGAPIISGSSLSNLGSGSIASGELLSLTGVDGSLLPLLANPGEMSPPLVVRFNTNTNYDILDNSDPGNPVDLDPPIRNQTFFIGSANNIFSTDPGETQVTMDGVLSGLPAGRAPEIGGGPLSNGYPREVISISRPSGNPGVPDITQNITTSLNSSARETASLLNNIDGVSANATSYMEISNTAGLTSIASPLQITLNGEDLIEYEFDSVTSTFVVASEVPDPVVDEDAFNDYLEARINSNSNLQAAQIYATAARNPITGVAEIRVNSSRGDNLEVSLIADNTGPDSLNIGDGENPEVALDGNGAGVSSAISVGGIIDIRLAEDISLGTLPPNSMLFGDTTAVDFVQSTYMGIQTTIKGVPQDGDTFTIDFNLDAALDNRNALNLVNLENAKTMGGEVASYSEGYALLVEKIGIDTASSRINRDAAGNVLQQSEDQRNSVSGVNLDEEAADLIRFEQMYSANAQVISVARDLFDRLISSF
ncbi:MAG: flagellar hook-associated protein 1 FlgK [Flavobacteriales bacterium]|jgi:flagellar hook-associated protein 1 FlgK